MTGGWEANWPNMHCFRNSRRKTEQAIEYGALCPGVPKLTGVSKVTNLGICDHTEFVGLWNSDYPDTRSIKEIAPATKTSTLIVDSAFHGIWGIRGISHMIRALES